MEKNLPNKILDSAIDPNLVASGMEIAEVGLDQLLDESFLKEIPVVSTIFGIIKGIVSVRDKIFMAKVLKFLNSIPKVAPEDLESFRKKIKSDLRLRKQVGDNLVLLIDRLNDLDKPEMLAKLFVAFLEGKIDHDQFRRLGVAVDRAFINDLRCFCRGEGTNLEIYPDLIHTGLVWFEVGKSWDDSGKILYNISTLGSLFIKIMKYDEEKISGGKG